MDSQGTVWGCLQRLLLPSPPLPARICYCPTCRLNTHREEIESLRSTIHNILGRIIKLECSCKPSPITPISPVPPTHTGQATHHGMPSGSSSQESPSSNPNSLQRNIHCKFNLVHGVRGRWAAKRHVTVAAYREVFWRTQLTHVCNFVKICWRLTNSANIDVICLNIPNVPSSLISP